jgi:voltage-gated potassium channel
MAKKKTAKKSTKKKASKKDILTKAREEEDKIDVKLMKKEEKFEKNLKGKIKHYFHLHMDNYESKHGRWIEGSLFVLNFIVIGLFIVSTYNLSQYWMNFVRWSEFSIICVFVVEYGVRMWVAPRKIKHFFNPYSIIDLLSIVPILVSFVNLGFLRLFRILRLVRLIRVLRFQRMFKAKHTMFGKFTEAQLIIVRIVLTVFTIIFVSAGLIWAVESEVNPEAFKTIWSAMYFAIVTLATVGYGDITPLSPLGRLITVGMILSGIALIPWQLGKLIKVAVMSTAKNKLICSKCGLELHEADAKHCKGCGKKLPKKKKEKGKNKELEAIEKS